MNLNSATVSNTSTVVSDYTIPAVATDGITGMAETFWQNSRWTTQYGFFSQVPDLKSAILMKAIWTVGKGFTCDPRTQSILEHIDGWGKDTFSDILFNLEVTRRIGGDAFAEIIRDPDKKMIINLKPLDPGSMRIIIDERGRIKKYQQMARTPTGKPITFEPNEIFHLSNNRVADQIHGLSDIDALENTILADEENFNDIRKVMHRQARPMIMFKIKTDDATQIRTFISKMDNATKTGDNIYIPNDDNTVEYEVVQVQVSDLIMAWRDDIRNKFYRSIGLPQVVPGAGGNSTESESKVIYLAFEQIIEKEQRQIEEQIWAQLDLKINLYPPATISQELQNDAAKDGAAAQLSLQPSDTTAGSGR